MKKIFVLMLIFAFLSVSAYAGDAEISFNPENFSVKVLVETPQKSDEVLTVSLWKGTDEIPGDKTADFAGLYMTENGKFDEEILIPYTLSSGKNTICIDSRSLKENHSVVILNPKDSASLDAAKNASQIAVASDMYDFLVTEKKGMLLGIDVDNPGILSDINGICPFLVDEIRAVSADEPLSFYNAFRAAYGIYLLKNDGDADEVFSKYGKYMGVDYEEFASQEDDVKSKITDLMKKSDTSDSGITEIYTNAFILAGITLSDNLEDFSAQIEKNASSIGIDMGEGSEYSKTEASLRYKVFVNMFEKRSSFLSFEDVADSFDGFVDDILKAQTTPPSSPSMGGGSSSGKKVSTSGVSAVPSIPAVQPDNNQIPKNIFSDMSGHYSEECVNRLASESIINGYADGTFKPDNLVTRAEFSKILVTALKLKSDGEVQSFNDVLSSDWYYESVCAMSSLGFITGYNNLFNPGANLTRQDAAVIAVRILGFFGDDTVGTETEMLDSAYISDYASEFVKTAVAGGIMTGSDSYFRPLDGIKRGEAAIVVSRIMSKINR